MGLLVYEVKENGEYNCYDAKFHFQIQLGKDQLRNYEVAKMLGANDEDDWYEWEEKVINYRKQNGEL